MSRPDNPQHIWSQPTDDNRCIVVEYSDLVPDGALGIIPCVDGHDAKSLIVAACSLATDPQGEHVYVFYERPDPKTQYLPQAWRAHAQLVHRMQMLREMGVGGPAPEPFVAPKWLEALDFHDKPIRKPRRKKSKRFARLDMPPPPVISNRFRKLEFD